MGDGQWYTKSMESCIRTQDDIADGVLSGDRRHAQPSRLSRGAFTLIELLVVITIIAIMGVVVVLVLNPAQLLAQSRDARRISDLSALNGAITFYRSQEEGATNYSLGSSTQAYLSVPDPSATSSAGSACQGLGVLSNPVYANHCAATSSYQNMDGTGWIPVDFSSLASGAPFSSLPVDPVNQTSSGLYYTYETNGAQFVVAALLESNKYAATAAKSGGIDPALYEVGTGVQSLPLIGRGLVGYWPINEGSGTAAYDYSGNAATGTWSGTMTNGSYYTKDANGHYVGIFDGTDNFLTMNSTMGVSGTFTVSVWANPFDDGTRTFFSSRAGGNTFDAKFMNGNLIHADIGNGSSWITTAADASFTYTTNTWYEITYVVTPTSYTIYADGNVIGEGTYPLSDPLLYATSSQFGVDQSGEYFYGNVADIRVYNRALSASEIKAIYEAGMP